MQNTIQSIAIVGAGAMGAAYAAMISDAGGFSLYFLAQGSRYHKLKNAPLTVNGKSYDISVKQPEEITEPADLIIVALKHHHLPEALQLIASATGPATTILSVMNGLESERIIGEVCGMDKIVYAIAIGIDAVKEGSRFTYARPGKILFGKTAEQEDDSRVAGIQDALTRAAIPHEVPDDIMRTMWWKFMINVGVNQASAVLSAPYGVFHTSPDAMALMQQLMQEVVILAEKVSINLTQKDLEDWTAVLSTLAPEGKTSMLQDIEAGRKTEVEIFSGTVISMGLEHNVPTPVNLAIMRIINVLEKRYNKKF